MARIVAVQIGTNLEYSAIHEFGGTIRPKNAQFLHFFVGGTEVFTKEVEIPARPYMRPAWQNKKREAFQTAARVTGAAMRVGL